RVTIHHGSVDHTSIDSGVWRDGGGLAAVAWNGARSASAKTPQDASRPDEGFSAAGAPRASRRLPTGGVALGARSKPPAGATASPELWSGGTRLPGTPAT